ncbi:uncharacterized protein LOC122721981 [Manihot esculenta]|uniref:uncharacterized protein LOC122721981 n=1 Tax=Manihot esculenta TaxID=3983 RepID=UPI001CC63D09|nr:uncharacterized protein LOC122721981 [Manihot esculenta]
MHSDRGWMYARLKDGLLNPLFLEGLNEFISAAKQFPDCLNGELIRCPCNRFKCQNRSFEDENTIRFHLMKYGFVRDYYVWYLHGEIQNYNAVHRRSIDSTDNTCNVEYQHGEFSNAYEQLVADAAGPSFSPSISTEPPNQSTQRLYDMLAVANKELWPGCENHSQLSAVARILNMKSEHHLSERCFDNICQLIKKILPTDNFYSTKKLLEGLGLPIQKIHSCLNGCMIYWGEDNELLRCKVCDHPRYKRLQDGQSSSKTQVAYSKMYYMPITPRLQRLYASNATAKDMTWHANHGTNDDLMHHPADSHAWKAFDNNWPHFSAEKRNVRLGLCTDGFQPFGQSGQQYSSWPVILTPYNLSLWLCMKGEYMFLTILVPGPRNPKDKLDVYLQPLVTELKDLWENGVETYDAFSKENFNLRAALMWTISDFPAYAMLSGWSTAGRTACPYCMEDSDAFTLTRGGKQSWFDNHRKFLPPSHSFRRNKTAFRKNVSVTKKAKPPIFGEEILKQINELGFKRVIDEDAFEINSSLSKQCGWRKRSILWDLPYWKSNLIRHNLDVMHIEKNFFENIINTVMSVEGKTKYNAKSRADLNVICDRPELEMDQVTGRYPKACYTLDKQSKQVLCDWLKNLKFPDGYVSNMGRCIDMKRLKMFGMKSHDCHVFMQRIIPIAFRELLPSNVWQPLTELSNFFRELTSTAISESDMLRLHGEIPLIICKLERVFPPSFFDCMEHLPVHLAYEAWLAGPVQYRWMYPFERYLRRLKNNVRNKARVEGSICNAYLVEEATSFCAHYFEPYVQTRHRKVPRNVDISENTENYEGNLSIFMQSGRPIGKGRTRYLMDDEYKAAQIIYIDQLRSNDPLVNDSQIDIKLESEFALWFNNFAHDSCSNISNKFIISLAKGPLRSVTSYNGYMVNGYKFQSKSYCTSRATMNSGVCIKGSNYSNEESDYYGQLLEVIRLEYPGLPIKRVVLFKCNWFDPTPNVGTKIHSKYKLIDVNHKRSFNRYEPFVLGVQAIQVIYTSYPSLRRDKIEWWAAVKVKARSMIQLPTQENTQPDEEPFQQDEMEHTAIVIEIDDSTQQLNDPTGDVIEIDDGEENDEDETIIATETDDDDDDDDNNDLDVDSE